jgi:hypothetical protein
MFPFLIGPLQNSDELPEILLIASNSLPDPLKLALELLVFLALY